MAALTGPREYKLEDGASVITLSCNSLTYKQGSMIGLNPSTGYAGLWDGTADMEFVGLATANGTSATTVSVDTRPVEIQGYRNSTSGITGGVNVTGASAVTDNGSPVYASTDNMEDFTLTATAGPPIGEVSKWLSSAQCWVRLYPKGYDAGSGAQTVTATTGGATTGLIKQGAKHVTVASDSADKQISLPAASIGDVINILVGGSGCELISAVAAHTVNDVVVGATNELALVATSLYRCEYVAANQWIVRGFTNLGADEAALVPDAL